MLGVGQPSRDVRRKVGFGAGSYGSLSAPSLSETVGGKEVGHALRYWPRHPLVNSEVLK